MLRRARGEDWAAICGTPEPAEWFGYAEARPHFIDGLGCVFLGVDGRWWVLFKRAPGVRKVKTAHAAARRLFAEAKDKGIEVHGLADPEISGAAVWMARLGFEQTDETREGHPVWVLR